MAVLNKEHKLQAACKPLSHSLELFASEVLRSSVLAFAALILRYLSQRLCARDFEAQTSLGDPDRGTSAV